MFFLTDLPWVERVPLRSQGVERLGRKGGGKEVGREGREAEERGSGGDCGSNVAAVPALDRTGLLLLGVRAAGAGVVGMKRGLRLCWMELGRMPRFS